MIKLKNSKIFVLGMARSGYEVSKYLSRYNNEIIVTDAKEQDSDKVKELESLGVKVLITDKPADLLDETFDLVIKNPGIKYTNPLVVKADSLGISVVNEMEVASYFFPEGLQVIGVTGSNGKTTTTNLINEMLKADHKNVIMAGNMGIPVCSILDDIKSDTILLLEVSIQQLCNLKHFKTNVSVLTNLTPTHIDFLDTYENYKNTKKRIFNNHSEKDIAILNIGNADEMELTKDIKSHKIYFSSKQETDICVKGNYLNYFGEDIIKLEDIKLKGMHNYENACCAIGVVKHYGVSNAAIIQVLKTFGGVEHRLEFVRNVNGVEYYNDSEATNTVSTIIALKAFKKPEILILGGLDRGHSFDPLNDYISNVKLVVCYGETKKKIEEWAHKMNLPVKVFDNLHDTTMYIASVAKAGDVVLLSPACASWDQYKCCEDRGDEFKSIVNGL